MKQLVSKIIKSLPPMEPEVRSALETALWANVPTVLKNNSIQNLALVEMLQGAPPRYDHDTEVSVLCRVLAYPETAMPFCSGLSQASFYDPQHALIWVAISALWQSKTVVAVDTVCNFIRQKGYEVDAFYLESLPTAAPTNTPYTWEEFGGLIQTLQSYQTARQVCDDALWAINEVFRLPISETQAVRLNLQDRLSKIQSGGGRMVDSQTAATELVERYQKNKELAATGAKISGVPTGFAALDRYTGGWQPSDLIILAARPSMGKTSLALKELYAAAQAGVPVAFFSLEMGRNAIVQRIFCMENECEYMDFTLGRMSPDLEVRLSRFERYFASLPFFIDDTPSVSAQYIDEVLQSIHSKHQIGLVVVDYLQLMTHSTKRNANDLETAGNASRGLKAIAKKYEVPVIALSQLSRKVEERADKRPVLSDLRNSGEIEQDADAVLFLYRPEYYRITQDEDGSDLRGVCEVMFAKHRNGRLGTVQLFYHAQFMAFKDLSLRPEDYQGALGSIGDELGDDEVQF